MKHCWRKKLDELNHVAESRKRKSTAEPIWLFIAEMVAETNGNMKMLCWVVGFGIAAGIAILVTLALRGLQLY